MAILIQDPAFEAVVRAEHAARGLDRYDEVWEGVLVVPPAPNTEHFRITSRINSACSAVIDWDRGDQAVPGGNVSDRDAGWAENYRIPDVLVYLAGNPAVDHGTHWVGGPDLAVEITSRGEDPHAKFDFYARIGTREVLLVLRNPWALELYRLQGGQFVLAGRSDPASPADVPSSVLPLSFRLDPATPRPVIVMTHTATGQTWTA